MKKKLIELTRDEDDLLRQIAAADLRSGVAAIRNLILAEADRRNLSPRPADERNTRPAAAAN
jgi:hypothetical protein